MRIRIVLDLKNKKIPVQYKSILVGIIYSFFDRNDDTTNLHNAGYIINNRKFKLFTFSEIYGKTQYIKEDKCLFFLDNGCFDFTSSDENYINQVVNYLNNNSSILFGNQIIKIVKYDILDDYCDNKEEEKYYTVSPITVYRTEGKFTKFFEPLDYEFKELIISNLASKYYLIYHENMPNIEITNIDNIKMKRTYFRKIMHISYHLNITFDKLTPKVKYVIQTCGLGAKNSVGYGMVSKVKNGK